MSIQRIIGIVALIGGIVLVAMAMYIKKEIVAGNEQISSGEKQISTLDKVFSLSPGTKPLGDQVTGSGKAKIAKGKEEIAHYTALAGQLQVGGIILIAIGAGMFLIGKKRKR